MTPREVKPLARLVRPRRVVNDIMRTDVKTISIDPGMPAADALALMQRTGESRLLTVAGGKLVGIVTLKDLLDFLSLEEEMEQAGSLAETEEKEAEEQNCTTHS